MYKNEPGGINLFYRIRYGMGIVWNYLRYKATISDYFELRFFEKNSKEKKEYLTSKDGLRFAQYVDSQEVFTQLCSKKEMYRELKKYVKRDQLYSAESTKEDFEKFVDKHNSFLYKPDVADCGRGIEKWTVSKGSIEDLYNKFKESTAVLDELVTQHQELSKLNPSSVNTIRIFTVMIGNECEIIGAALRMGVGAVSYTHLDVYKRQVLDVFEEEPLGEDSPLWEMEKVIVIPHNSFVGDGNARRLAGVIYENIRRELSDKYTSFKSNV